VADYRFVNEWRLQVGHPLAYPRWWSEVFVAAEEDGDEPAPGKRVAVEPRLDDATRTRRGAARARRAGSATGRLTGYGAGGTTLPGLRIPFGSSSCLIPRSSGSRSPCSRSR